MADRALLLSADLWEMADEKTGEIRRGASVWYINDLSLIHISEPTRPY